MIAFVFFIAMLVDSFWEGRAPESRTLGVPRLNTRLAFYIYERRKLELYAVSISSASYVVSDELQSINSESTLFTYVIDEESTL